MCHVCRTYLGSVKQYTIIVKPTVWITLSPCRSGVGCILNGVKYEQSRADELVGDLSNTYASWTPISEPSEETGLEKNIPGASLNSA